MSRTPKPVRFLTATDLGIVSLDQRANEAGIAPSGGQVPATLVPEQKDAPITTSIVDYKLVKTPGRLITKTLEISGVSEYLESRFKQTIIDIEGNANKLIIEDFRQGEQLLHDWSTSKLLAFGTHLYLLESHIEELKAEIIDDKARRLYALMRSAREFINSFEEWHIYVEQSTLLDIKVGEGKKGIIAAASGAAETLIQENESIDPKISSELREYANIANNRKDPQSVVVSLMSALRSITNISITFTEYVVKIAKDGYESITQNERALKLLKAICRFFPIAMRLAASRPDFSWLLSYSDDIRAACDILKR